MKNYMAILEYHYNSALLQGTLPTVTLLELEDLWKESDTHLL